MPVSSNDRVTAPAQGDGVNKNYTFDFTVLNASDLLVLQTVIATGAESTISSGAYSVSLNADQNNNPGGSITYTTAPPSTVNTVITSAMDYDQENRIRNKSTFAPEVVNEMVDKLTILTQQLKSLVDRSVVAPFSTSFTTNQISGTIDATQRVLLLSNAGPVTAELSSVGSSLDTVLTGIANGDALTYSSGNWVNVDTAELLTGSTFTASRRGAMVVQNADDDSFEFLPQGTSGHPLVSAGADALPAFGQIGAAGIADNAVSQKQMAQDVVALSAGAGTKAIDTANGNVFTLTVSGGTNTFTFATAETVDYFFLQLTNGASQTRAWPASLDWPDDGTEPILQSSGVDILLFKTFDGGTTWYGSLDVGDAA